MLSRVLCLLWLYACCVLSVSANQELGNKLSIDSLIANIDSPELADSSRFQLYFELYNYFESKNIRRAESFNQRAYSLAKRLKNKGWEVLCLRQFRRCSELQRKWVEMMRFNDTLRAHYEIVKDSTELLECALREVVGLRNEKKYNEATIAIEKLKALNLARKKEYECEMLNQIGNLYWVQNKLDSAEKSYTRLLELSEEGDLEMRNIALINLAAVEFNKGNYEEAKRIYKKLAEREENDPLYRLNNYINVSAACFKLGELDTAYYYDHITIALAKRLNQQKTLKTLYGYMYQYFEERNLDSAYYYLTKKREASKKSIEENGRFLLESIKQGHLIDSKIKALELRNKEQKEQNEQETIYAQVFLAFLLISSIIAVFYLFKERAKKAKIVLRQLEIVKVKDLLEKRNQEFMLNFDYAKSIQEAVLPGTNLQDAISSSFVFYKPKDIVSGDFYWVSSTKDKKVIVAVGDCTGHGVPGGLMSIMGTAFINELFSEYNISAPSELLGKLRDRIIEGLNQKGIAGEARDGMDISVGLFDLKKNKLRVSGANNPLYIVRNGELMIYEADPQPVGFYTGKREPFTEQEVSLETGDMIYMATDGFQDQFGGERGKKYMKKRFKELLLSISDLDILEQKNKLELELIEWMADEEQVDDVCVLGIKI